MPFNDHTISELKNRLTKHQAITESFPSLLPSGRDLVKSQTGSFLKLARFNNTELPECNDIVSEAELKMWH
jgi:hypothetical protein